MKNKLMTAEEMFEKQNPQDGKLPLWAKKLMEEYRDLHLKQFVEECKKHTVTLKVDNIETSFLVVDKSLIDQTLTDYLDNL